MDILQQNKLLYSRAGFGISMDNYLHPKPIEQIIGGLFPEAQPEPLLMISDAEWEKHSPKAMKEMDNAVEKKEMQKEFRQKTRDLNLLWLQEMVTTKYPLREKTALFWHGHFATRIENPYYDQKLLQVIRKNALGSFKEMLFEVSKSSAMLQFLNNQQNKKMHPNENFAREVMELFTLGRGHYTEDDIKEAARAFTGWAFDGNGDFIFRQRQHDDGVKKFLGKTGNFNGDDILDILLEQKQTAVFITQKLYRYFVSDEQIDEKRVKELAAWFYESKYDIGGLLKNIFSSDWFYKEKTIGVKIKSPIELLVGYQRMLPMQFANNMSLVQLQRILGQFLFNPPNVAGWPGGKSWIDSSTLVIRMRLPEALLASKELDLSAKDIDPEAKISYEDGNMHMGGGKQYGKLNTTVDWSGYLGIWKNYSRGELPAAMADILLNTPVDDKRLEEVVKFTDHDSDEEYVKSLTILLMELPEYQLA